MATRKSIISAAALCLIMFTIGTLVAGTTSCKCAENAMLHKSEPVKSSVAAIPAAGPEENAALSVGASIQRPALKWKTGRSPLVRLAALYQAAGQRMIIRTRRSDLAALQGKVEFRC